MLVVLDARSKEPIVEGWPCYVSRGIPVLGVGEDEVRRARRLLEVYPALSTRDGVHLGVMETHAMVEILTYDRGFDHVDWARRLEPEPP